MIGAALSLVISGLLFSYLYLYKTPAPIIPKRDVCKFCDNVQKQAPALDSTELSIYLNKKVNIKSDTLDCKNCRIVISDSIFKKIIPLKEMISSDNSTNTSNNTKSKANQKENNSEQPNPSKEQ
jgi:hypothetical protein